MRLFVGVEISPDLARSAGTLLEDLRRRAAHLAPRSRITWVSPDRLHFTLSFIGEADEDHVQGIREALAPSVPLPPFDLTVAGVGAFPRTGQPRVLWAGLTDGREALVRLERVVASRLSAAGVAGEPRAYNPHLTLARVREAGGLRTSALYEGLPQGPVGTTRVEAFTLFESRLSSAGPTYVPLQRTVLRAPGPA